MGIYEVVRGSTFRTFRNEPRRHFSAQYKRELVERVLASPLSLARVAREHDLNHSRLARWRREYEQGKYALTDAKDVSLLAVCVDGMSGAPEPERTVATLDSRAQHEAAVSIELHLPKGKVIINGMDEQQLRRLFEGMQ